MKVFDIFPFFNELDLLELRLNILSPHVDYFVISESTVTFSGLPKPLYYSENKGRFKKFEGKIIHNVVDSTPNDFSQFVPPNKYYTDWDRSYPHKSNGVPLRKLSLSFQREVFQRDSVINGLIGRASEQDLIMISDVDEIPNPEFLKAPESRYEPGRIYNFAMRWFMYRVNVMCDHEWFGTRICRFRELEGRSVDLLRYHLEDRSQQPGPIVENAGWHLSFLGGHDAVKYKLKAYDYQGRKTRWLLNLMDRLFRNRVERKIRNNEDIFNTGRKFTMVDMEKVYPPEILHQLNRFQHHIKQRA
jgi:beta-1,4-mannosyl-glycoprotein beta-1,4-N-acetylglucosaminyltransferase